MTTAIRIFLGLVFFTAGMSKLTHGSYTSLIGPVWLIDRLAPHGLAFWAAFVAWSQMLIGLMLFSRRLATLGAVMLVPMLANILVVTISLEWRGTPYVNGVLLAMNGWLLYVDRARLRALVADAVPASPPGTTSTRVTVDRTDAMWLLAAVLCAAAALLQRVSPWMPVALSVPAIALLVAARRVR